MGARLRFLALMASAAVALSCGDGDDAAPRDPAGRPEPGDAGPIHVHGLGINPADRALFVATHTGLFRAAPGERRASRVADRFQDTMGFTVIGPNLFLGSGHPDLRDEMPSFLGLIESRDGGETWRPISLLGERDFHVLEAAGNRVYGFGSDFHTRKATLLVSSDAGRSWDERPPPEGLLALAIDPTERDRMVASGGSRLYRSDDGGRSWQTLGRGPALLAWPTRSQLLAVDARGRVSRSPDAGRTWSSVGEVGGKPSAFDSGGGRLYVGLHDGVVKQSSDGGRTWSVRSTP